MLEVSGIYPDISHKLKHLLNLARLSFSPCFTAHLNSTSFQPLISGIHTTGPLPHQALENMNTNTYFCATLKWILVLLPHCFPKFYCQENQCSSSSNPLFFDINLNASLLNSVTNADTIFNFQIEKGLSCWNCTMFGSCVASYPLVTLTQTMTVYI